MSRHFHKVSGRWMSDLCFCLTLSSLVRLLDHVDLPVDSLHRVDLFVKGDSDRERYSEDEYSVAGL